MMLVTIASFGRKHVENATVVADTIFYAENMSNVANADQAAYYRILMTTGSGITKKNVFQDFYMNGNLRAEGGYSFIDLGDDRNTVFNGEVTSYYKNGKEKWHGKYVNGKREGYFTLQLRDGGVAVAQSREHLGAGPHRNTELASTHKLGVGLGNSGRDHDHVGLDLIDRGGLVAHMNLHASTGKLTNVARGLKVGTGNGIATLVQNESDAAHAGATDTDKVGALELGRGGCSLGISHVLVYSLRKHCL